VRTISEPLVSRFEAALLTAMFAVLISLPLCKQMIRAEPGTETMEGRPLNPRPELHFKKGLRDFPINFEAYYNDHFGFRAALLRIGGYIGVQYANVSLSPDVIIGKEGWLFKKSGLSVDSYHGGPVLSRSDLARWKNSLESRKSWLEKRGIRFLFVVPPDKQTIYPEFMPDKYNKSGEQTPGEQLSGYLSKEADIPLLSLIGPLKEAKGRGGGRLYFRHDTHWNSMGAYAGYYEIMNRLHEWFPDVKPKGPAEFRLGMKYCKGDLARMMGMPGYSAGDEPTLFPLSAAPPTFPIAFNIEGVEPGDPRYFTQISHASPGRKAVVVYDSFTWLLKPLMAGDFAHITYLWREQDDAKFEKAVGEIVKSEKPDIFIEERLERFLQEPPPDETIIFGGACN